MATARKSAALTICTSWPMAPDARLVRAQAASAPWKACPPWHSLGCGLKNLFLGIKRNQQEGLSTGSTGFSPKMAAHVPQHQGQ